MRSSEITTLLADYDREILKARDEGALEPDTATHLQAMIPTMRDMNPNIDEAIGKERIVLMRGALLQREKLMRWLGFMQGVFYANGVFDLDQLQAHNKTGRVGVVANDEPEFGDT